MLTKRAQMTKWTLYSLAVLAFILLQQLVLDEFFYYLGIVPFLMPMIVAVAAALEGPTGGTIFGIAVGCLCDLSGSGVFSGIYTLAFFCIALCVAIISKYYVMRNVFGSLIYALIAFVILDAIQILFLITFHGASLSVAALLAGKEIALSILFVIPIFFLFSFIHRLFRYD